MFNRAERLSKFCRQSPKEHSCVINYFKIHELAKEEKSFEDFLFLALATILFNGAEQFEQFGRELPKEPSCETIPKSVHRFNRKSCLKLFSIYSPGGHFVQWSGTI